MHVLKRTWITPIHKKTISSLYTLPTIVSIGWDCASFPQPTFLTVRMRPDEEAKEEDNSCHVSVPCVMGQSNAHASYVVYKCTNIPHICRSNMWHVCLMPNLVSIFVSDTYLPITYEIENSVFVFWYMQILGLYVHITCWPYELYLECNS